MAARKKSTAPEPRPEQAPESADAPKQPVRKVSIAREKPARAGGYVLTERGWVRE